MEMSDYIAFGALLFSMLSFAVTLVLDRRTKSTERRLKAEEIRLNQIAKEQADKAEMLRSLQGDMESVGYTAMYFAQAGLPDDPGERQRVVGSLVNAAVFSGSDRARAMIYHVLRGATGEKMIDVSLSIQQIDNLFEEATKWGLDSKELDLERGRRRVKALKKVLAANGT